MKIIKLTLVVSEEIVDDLLNNVIPGEVVYYSTQPGILTTELRHRIATWENLARQIQTQKDSQA